MQEGLYGKCSDSQTFTNTDSTGEISSNMYDLEESAITDDQLFGFLNLTVISATLTSGLTEGIHVAVRTDDATDLATAKDGAGAGYVEVGGIEIPKEEIVAGRQFSIAYLKDIAKRYIGGWVKAVSTQLTGNIVLDMEFSDHAVSANERIQKIPS